MFLGPKQLLLKFLMFHTELKFQLNEKQKRKDVQM